MQTDMTQTIRSQDEQKHGIQEFAVEVTECLNIAETNFDDQRQIIELLDVTVTLAVEDRQQVVPAH
jgi:hypothetical protein